MVLTLLELSQGSPLEILWTPLTSLRALEVALNPGAACVNLSILSQVLLPHGGRL